MLQGPIIKLPCGGCRYQLSLKLPSLKDGYISRRRSGASDARNDFSRNKIIFLANMESDVFSFRCCSFARLLKSVFCVSPVSPPSHPSCLHIFFHLSLGCRYVLPVFMLPYCHLGLNTRFFPSFVRPSVRGFFPGWLGPEKLIWRSQVVLVLAYLC